LSRVPPHPGLLPWGEGDNICRVYERLRVFRQEIATVAWIAGDGISECGKQFVGLEMNGILQYVGLSPFRYDVIMRIFITIAYCSLILITGCKHNPTSLTSTKTAQFYSNWPLTQVQIIQPKSQASANAFIGTSKLPSPAIDTGKYIVIPIESKTLAWVLPESHYYFQIDDWIYGIYFHNPGFYLVPGKTIAPNKNIPDFEAAESYIIDLFSSIDASFFFATPMASDYGEVKIKSISVTDSTAYAVLFNASQGREASFRIDLAKRTIIDAKPRPEKLIDNN